MACEALSGVTGVERVWNLPTSTEPSHAVLSSLFSAGASWQAVPRRPLERVVLRDRWGKELMAHRLDNYRTVTLPATQLPFGPTVTQLEPELELVRCRAEEGGVVSSLSDGTELACTGVIFADGPGSRGRALSDKPVPGAVDAKAVACWSFCRSDLLSVECWEFRTALGKSVEVLPLPQGRLRVKLRFRTAVGARQTAAQLRDLFSEFGPDIEALLEGVEDHEIRFLSEESPVHLAFSPLPGTFALGQAALGAPLLESFDWTARLALRQLERLVESVVVGHWEPSAWEPLSRDTAESILRSERYLRDFLHYDNALLRPLRDLALRLLPAKLGKDRVRNALGFTP